MKRFLLIFILLLVGCKSNREDSILCIYKDINRKDTITIYFKNDISDRYKKETIIKLDSSKEASNYKDDNYDEIRIVDKEVIMNTMENIDDLNKSEVISLYEKLGYNCK